MLEQSFFPLEGIGLHVYGQKKRMECAATTFTLLKFRLHLLWDKPKIANTLKLLYVYIFTFFFMFNVLFSSILCQSLKEKRETWVTLFIGVQNILQIFIRYMWEMGHAVAQWLRHYATNWKVTGSIPDGVTGVFHWHNPSGHTMALGSTQPLTEMCTRNISLV
jgi:hypothetical protein